MKQSVLSSPARRANLPRNGFDRGYEIKFQQSCGHLLPIFAQPVLGESKVTINRESIIRAAQVNTAALARVSHNIDFYFVPFRQLYSLYGVKRTATKDIHSSLINQSNINARIPFISPAIMQNYLEQPTSVDVTGVDVRIGSMRLLDVLGYGINFNNVNFDDTSDLITWPNGAQVTQGIACNPFRLLAYQKVFYDHYRVSNYEPNQVQAYNIDDLANTNGSFNIARLQLCTELHLAPYRKDYLLNIYPSLNYASSSVLLPNFDQFFRIPSFVQNAQFQIEDPVSGSDDFYTQSTRILNRSTSLNGLTTLNSPSIFLEGDTDSGRSIPVAFSAQSIRALFALDKMTRLAAYAPQHVADQFEARFGFRPYAEDLNESKYLGSFKSDMAFQEVVSTAQTDGASLGQIGARGFTADGMQRDINFNVPEDGIIIGVSYFLPRRSYDSGFVDKFNTFIDVTEFPQPEFMDLGLQPLRQYEIYRMQNLGGSTQWSDSIATSINNTIRGYQPAYSEWKIGRDVNTGLFINGKILSPFSTHTNPDYSSQVQTKNPTVVPSYLREDGVSPFYFYCQPRDMDDIFMQSFNGWLDSDQFFGMVRFKFNCIQNLSVHGQSDL